jgi:hypothetical protein
MFCYVYSQVVDDDDESAAEDSEVQSDSLSAAIMYEYSKIAEEGTSQFSGMVDTSAGGKRKKYQKDSYFSDEEELE